MGLGFRFFILLGIGAALSACASVPRQTMEVVKNPPPIEPSQQLLDVPFVEQEAGYCGPAVMTMAMRHAGLDVSIGQVAPEVFTPGAKGSLQIDLIAAARRHGLMAIKIEGLSQVLTEVDRGTPVLVFENLGLSFAPRWHYALIVGYDLPKQEILLHSGPDPFKRESFRRFERSWGLGEYWAIVLLPPNQLAVTAGELAHLQAAAGLEQVGFAELAREAYQNILSRWPKSLGALIGLANIAYQNKQSSLAVELLRMATAAHPESISARHNLMVALEAEKSARPKPKKANR